jgi:glycosyltransferase involved in cell wall biosynthesis
VRSSVCSGRRGFSSADRLRYNDCGPIRGDLLVKLSVLIPCYNESETIREIVDRVRAVQVIVRIRDGRHGGSVLPDGTVELMLEKELVIVDDGSVDGTRELLPELALHPDVFVYYHKRNMGKGAAVRTAIEKSRGDILVVQDADLEYDPRDYPLLVQPILEGRARVVYGSRFLGGPRKAMFFSHMLGNKILTLFTNVLFDTILSDMETCYKVFSREVAEQLHLKSPGWGFDPEITAKILKRGYRIYEVPISYTGREYDEGKKINWRDGFTVMWTLLKYRLTE